MARKELRHCTVRVQDGFAGSALVDDMSIQAGDSTLGIDTLDLIQDRTIVPVGAHFRLENIETIFVVTAQNANKVATATFTADDGTWKATIGGMDTIALDWDASVSAVQAAVDTVVGPGEILVSGTAGALVFEFLNGSSPTFTTASIDLELSSNPVTITNAVLHVLGTTWRLTFSPAIASGDVPSNDDTITFLPRWIDIKIGDGDAKWTEKNEYNYDLDKGNLDAVREGNQVPMDLSLAFVFEHVKSGTGEAITPMEAIKGIGAASDWTSSAEDLCEPFAVDIVIIDAPPCGTAAKETFLFPDFRSENREGSFKDATVNVTGRCNAIEPVVTRD
jgi:hypothetical protein